MPNVFPVIADEASLAAMLEAIDSRADELRNRRRLPRGLSVADIMGKLDRLERFRGQLTRELGRRRERSGVEVGDRVPAALDLASGDA